MKPLKFILPLLLLFLLLTPLSAQRYIEEPSHQGPSVHYVTTTMSVPGYTGRSYTLCYDPSLRIARWVAYPLNKTLIGEGRRGEDWLPEPTLPEETQAILYRSFGNGYDRGHQIPSADRLEADANAQTFRFTNATPQLHGFNGGIWAELEKVVRTWAKRSDTLYVVTGAVKGKNYANDNAGNPVNIPSAYYKTVLRRNTDKAGRVRWSACSVILIHEDTPVGTWKDNLVYFKENSLSVQDLEEITGESFFPRLKEVLGETEYRRLIDEHPKDNTWWWK